MRNLNTQNQNHLINQWATDLDKRFSKEKMQMANGCLRTHSTSSAIGEMQIKLLWDSISL